MFEIRLPIAIIVSNLFALNAFIYAQEYESGPMLKGSEKNRNQLNESGQALLKQNERKLQLEVPCGTILDSIAPEEMPQILNTLGYGTLDIFAKDIRYGLQVRKICSSCSAVLLSGDESLRYNSTALNDLCGKSVYGHTASYSGLILLPMITNGNKLIVKPGALVGHVYSRSTRIESFVSPSTTWPPAYDILGSLIATSVSGAVSIVPDFIGYGESASLHRAYLIKKGYLSSTIPLWIEAKTIIVKESGGHSSLENMATFAGYSEGAYASVALADGFLSALGTNILGVMAGGGPYRVSSALLLSTIRNIENIKPEYDFIGTLWGGSYSSTYPEVANYGSGQHILDSSSFYSDGKSQDPVEWLREPDITGGEINRRLSKVPKTSIIDNGFLNFIYEAIAFDNQYPCATGVETGFNDKLCAALIENDLTNVLENAEYDITLIHSPFDDLVSISNLPDCDSNPDNLKCKLTLGDHNLAYPLFLGSLGTYFTSVGDYQPVEDQLQPTSSFWCAILFFLC